MWPSANKQARVQYASSAHAWSSQQCQYSGTVRSYRHTTRSREHSHHSIGTACSWSKQHSHSGSSTSHSSTSQCRILGFLAFGATSSTMVLLLAFFGNASLFSSSSCAPLALSDYCYLKRQRHSGIILAAGTSACCARKTQKRLKTSKKGHY